MHTVLIGIDDTDNPDSPGTGQLARRLSQEICRCGGTLIGTTRHQFLVDPQIPCTAHNRGICVAVAWPAPLHELTFVFDLVTQWSAAGSDPGVCLTTPENVPPEITRWGERAMREVLTIHEAQTLAKQSALDLRPLGGTGGGIIGALASVGLRIGGQHGRFVDMPHLRDLGEEATADQLSAMGIRLEHASQTTGRPLRYKTLGWVRPRLAQGQPVLAVDWSDDDHAWIPVDRKTVHPLD